MPASAGGVTIPRQSRGASLCRLERKDLEAFIGSRHRVSEVLNRRLVLSLDMIRRLHAGLEIPLEVLIGKLHSCSRFSLFGNCLIGQSYRKLQRALMENPEMGDVMPGTGGFRKVRW